MDTVKNQWLPGVGVGGRDEQSTEDAQGSENTLNDNYNGGYVSLNFCPNSQSVQQEE